MTDGPDDLLPESYWTWPRSIQRRFIEEYYALYFPEETEGSRKLAAAAAAALVPQPGDADVVDAEIVEDPRPM